MTGFSNSRNGFDREFGPTKPVGAGWRGFGWYKKAAPWANGLLEWICEDGQEWRLKIAVWLIVCCAAAVDALAVTWAISWVTELVTGEDVDVDLLSGEVLFLALLFAWIINRSIGMVQRKELQPPEKIPQKRF
jgi:hypothetical protein